MERACQGDGEAYRKLLLEISDVMERYLKNRFGESHFVEDCVQESLLSIHRARASYDPTRSFRSWMFAIVRHKAIDLLRRRGVRRQHEVSDEQAALRQPDHSNFDPANSFGAAKLLQQLDPKYREALILTKIEGRTVEEAAHIAGTSLTAMKSRVQRAIRQAGSLLRKEGS